MIDKLQGQLSHAPAVRSVVLRVALGKMQGLLLSSASSGEGQGGSPALRTTGGVEGRRYLSLIHATMQEMSGRASSLTLTPSGLATFKSHNALWGAGSALSSPHRS